MEDYDLETLVSLLDDYIREHIEEDDDSKFIEFGQVRDEIQETLDEL